MGSICYIDQTIKRVINANFHPVTILDLIYKPLKYINIYFTISDASKIKILGLKSLIGLLIFKVIQFFLGNEKIIQNLSINESGVSQFKFKIKFNGHWLHTLRVNAIVTCKSEIDNFENTQNILTTSWVKSPTGRTEMVRQLT